MPKNRFSVNPRLLTVITGISILLGLLTAVAILNPKPLSVRIVDNIFLGAFINLAASLYFRLRGSSEEKVQADRIEARAKKQKLKKSEHEALKRYDMFSLFAKHFGWSSLVLFILSAIGTIMVSFGS